MRYLPYVLAVVVLAGFTAYQGIITDRWRDNIEAKECAALLDSIPNQIGDWVGVDDEVPDEVRNTAGAEGYVSRVYTNSRTKETVKVWFIVGHSFNIWRHTPTVCYRASGFEQAGGQEEVFTIQAEGEEPANFFTTTFKKGQYAERVFWGWSKPVRDASEAVEWVAPRGSKGLQGWLAPKGSRGHFGNMRALYKLYFTSGVKSENEKPDESVCIEFAEEFLPVANKILQDSVPAPSTNPAATEATAADSPAAT